MKNQRLLILGTRGIPGSYGGFETFAERLALHLVGKGWDVVVYCQCLGGEHKERTWKGITLVDIPVPKNSAFWSIIFDLRATLHALRQPGIILLLGYNTAIFSLLYYLRQRTVITNMDGMEWCRRKWNLLQKTWLFLNERCAIWFSNHLIADHPQMKVYFVDRGIPSNLISSIPYCSEAVPSADISLLSQYGLVRNQYALVIARPEPENSILEIVTAFSQRRRGHKLVILGNYLPTENAYHKEVLAAASEEIIFLGAIYDKAIVRALRYYACLYVHGHKVGGTNPSLIEALAAGMPVLAHYNRFNFWVAGSGSRYFYDQEDFGLQLEQILADPKELRDMKKESLRRYEKMFSDDQDLEAYRELLETFAGVPDHSVPEAEVASRSAVRL